MKIRTIKLRPHHLLCTQGFGGKGYDDVFAANMTEITDYLRNTDNVAVEIVFGVDDICEKCPNITAENLCANQAKVTRFDKKVIEYFKIEERTYIYRKITEEINKRITAQIMSAICSECEWFSVGECKNVFSNMSNKF